ncbi:MAG: competence/damage-inducible protein A [Gammaproteobacteria bacterium]|nr:competence/damage-inducible protein A [Gammaproteobacteria bacterium]
MPQTTVTAAVLIIGNEILSGRTQDTNLAHIARTIGEWGIRVREVRVVPDIEAEIIEATRALSRRYDYVFTTGGIGPTHDDITAECIAKAFNKALVEHPAIGERIRSRAAPPEVMASRLRMARVPEGATLIDNPTGGPQGFVIENVYVMAGIPMVMQGMLSTLAGKLRGGAVVKALAVTAYLGESQIAAALGEIQDRYPSIDLGSYPFAKDGRYGTTLVMRGTEDAELERMRAEVRSVIEAAGETPVDAAAS